MPKDGNERTTETRSRSIEDFQIDNSNDTGGAAVIEGYAAVFDSEAEIGDISKGGFYEIIDRGAFNKCDITDVSLNYNHSSDAPILARTKNGSLQLQVDEKGLKVRAELLDTQDAKDMYKRIKSGLISAMSFAFIVDPDGQEITERNGIPVRRITKIQKLFDVSIVNQPAYESTSIYARSLELAKNWRAEEKNKKTAAEIRAAIIRWS